MSSLISSSETDARDLLLDIVVGERRIMRRRRRPAGFVTADERPAGDRDVDRGRRLCSVCTIQIELSVAS